MSSQASRQATVNEQPFKYRVLIVGESGVGKSSLLKAALGVDCSVCNDGRGETNIEHEYPAPKDNRFVVHDSRGFEAAEKQNLEDAHKFIKERKSMPDLKDQLHAVWLCLEIPYAGARLIESAGEYILKRRKEVLGNIPLILIFSKYDLVVSLIEVEALSENKNLSDQERTTRYNELMERRCLTPIEKKAGPGDPVPHIIVSSKYGYEDTLNELRNRTAEIIQTYIKNETALNAPMVRRNESKAY